MISLASVFAVFGLGGPALLLILAVVLLLFGAKKLPELAKGLGKSVKEFKKATVEEEEDVESPKPTAVATTETKKPDAVRTHGSN